MISNLVISNFLKNLSDGFKTLSKLFSKGVIFILGAIVLLYSITNVTKINSIYFINQSNYKNTLLSTNIMEFINTYYSIQNPLCDKKCSNDCLNEEKNKILVDFKNCIAENCQCLIEEANISSNLGAIILIVFSFMTLYLAVFYSLQEPVNMSKKELNLEYCQEYEESDNDEAKYSLLN